MNKHRSKVIVLFYGYELVRTSIDYGLSHYGYWLAYAGIDLKLRQYGYRLVGTRINRFRVRALTYIVCLSDDPTKLAEKIISHIDGRQNAKNSRE